MNSDFLTRILATKEREVSALRANPPRVSDATRLTSRSFARAVLSGSQLAVVAEVKKASPSRGVIAEDFNPVETAAAYEEGGASCISVLTDESYFMGSLVHLTRVRQNVSLPVLRKDFIVDELQVDEAYVAGADAILLICAALTKDRLRALASHARSLSLETLVEVHDERELDSAMNAEASVVGVNNRNLATFQVSLETSERLIPLLPKNVPALAESGVKTAADAARMAACGASGILVGESLMRVTGRDSIAKELQALRVVKPLSVAGSGR